MRNFPLARGFWPWSMSAIAPPLSPLTMTEPRTADHPAVADPEDVIDVQLMRRIATGDEAAFRSLVERHQGAVIGTIARMISDAIEAEDLAQRVFLRVWKHAHRWQPDAKFRTYLFTIVRNLVFNESRRRSRRREVSADERHEDHGFDPPADARREPQAEVLRHEMTAEIDSVIASLPEAQRTAVVLYAYESMSYEEIALVLESSVSSVKSLLFRARTTLRERLSHHLGY